MYFISVTRLRIKSFWYLPQFFFANSAAEKQLKKTPGFIEGKELIDKHMTFWTLTAWKDEQSMKLFRNGKAHQQAMRKLPGWCDEATYAHWTTEEYTFPDWLTAYEKLITEGRTTKVKEPSANHLNKNFPAPNASSKLQKHIKTAG